MSSHGYGSISTTALSGLGGSAIEHNPRAAAGLVLQDRMARGGKKPQMIQDPRVAWELHQLAAEARNAGPRARWAMGMERER